METTLQTNKDKMPWWYVLAWNSRALSVAISVVVMMQITFFATEYAGLTAGFVGTLFLVSKIFDGLTDLFAGFIIDRTNTKLGKARPYEFFIIPLWLLIVFLFSVPDMGTTAKAAYIFVVYTLINSVCGTFLQASEAVFLGRAVHDDAGRAKIMAIGGVIVMFVCAIASMLLPQLMNTWGKEPGGWTKIALVYAVPMMLIGMIRFICIREKPVAARGERHGKISLMADLKILFKNKYIFILSAMILLSYLAHNMGSIVGTYYFQYVMGDLGLMSLVGMVGLLSPFVFLLFPVALRTIGSVGFVRAGLILAAIASALRFFFPTSLPVLISTGFLSGVGISSITMMNHFFTLQCVEYGERKTGVRVEGTPAALTGFTSKVGSGLASAGVGAIMALGGYVGTASVQPESAVMAIRLLYSLIPAAMCVLMLIVLHFFNVEKVLYAEKKEQKA